MLYPEQQFRAPGLPKLVAQLIEADPGARIFYVTLNGFDTHANQLQSHQSCPASCSDGVTAFFKRCRPAAIATSALLMTFSEFGRRAKEEIQSQRHRPRLGRPRCSWWAAASALVGHRGNIPAWSDLVMDKLKHHTDFRQVYAAVLEQWLGIASKPVLDGRCLSRGKSWRV